MKGWDLYSMIIESSKVFDDVVDQRCRLFNDDDGFRCSIFLSERSTRIEKPKPQNRNP